MWVVHQGRPPRALDLLGFRSQLVFNTFLNDYLCAAEHKRDTALASASRARTTVRMLDSARSTPGCCRRLRAARDFRSGPGVGGDVMPPGRKRCSCRRPVEDAFAEPHRPLPVWAQAEEAGLPIPSRRRRGTLIDPSYFKNGLPPYRLPRRHGELRSVDFMAIPFPPMLTLATLIIDGVLDRFPRLRFGVIEQGAVAAELDAPARHGARGLPQGRGAAPEAAPRPSEYVRRQIRATPYPTEPVGWIVEQAGEEVCLFSPTTRTSRAGGIRSPLRGGMRTRRAREAALLRELRRPDGRGLPVLQ